MSASLRRNEGRFLAAYPTGECCAGIASAAPQATKRLLDRGQSDLSQSAKHADKTRQFVPMALLSAKLTGPANGIGGI
jgi:hypothetical protein